MGGLLNETWSSSSVSEEEDVLIKNSWSALVTKSKLTWKKATEADIFDSTPLVEGEAIELTWGVLDEDVDNEIDEDEMVEDFIDMAFDDNDNDGVHVEVGDRQIPAEPEGHVIGIGGFEVEGDRGDEVDGVE